MPQGPFPVYGIIQDDDGSTNVNGASVVAHSVKKSDGTLINLQTSTTTNSSGEFVLDLSNLGSDYANGDQIQVVAYNGSGSNHRSIDLRYTLAVSDGSKNFGTVYLHPTTDHHFGTQGKMRLIGYVVSKNTAGDGRVDLFDRKNDRRVMVLRTTDEIQTVSQDIGYVGVEFEQGICVIMSNPSVTAGLPDMQVTLVTK